MVVSWPVYPHHHLASVHVNDTTVMCSREAGKGTYLCVNIREGVIDDEELRAKLGSLVWKSDREIPGMPTTLR